MKKIIVRGPALSQSGYGEQTRFALRSLRAFPDHFDVYLLVTSWGRTGWIWEETEERSWIDSIIQKTQIYVNNGGQFDLSLQVGLPTEFERLAPTNIGYTAGIETTKIAPQWINPSNAMNRIIVVSEHAKYGMVNTTYPAHDQSGRPVIASIRTPVEVVGYPVRKVQPKEIDLKLDYDFNFLAISQWSPRKNFEKLVRNFVEEFSDQEVGLVLKTSKANNSLVDRHFTEKALADLLNEYKERKCKVYLLHGDLTEAELAFLYTHPKIKALVNLAHGEGFGLPMFEAAYYGLPVIAPLWGGQADYAYLEQRKKVRKGKKVKVVSKVEPMFTPVEFDLGLIQKEAVWEGVLQADSQWCFPKDWRVKVRLREVYKQYAEALAKAKKLEQHLVENWTEDKLYSKFASAVLGEQVVKAKEVDTKDLPKISILTSVYNGDDYIEGFLEDITSQTIFKDKCELVLVNANSPGNEEEVIKKYIEKYPDNIKYERLSEDPGIYGTWNYALKLATGEYITNANLDDRKAINSLELHAKELLRNEDVELVYADSYIVDEPGVTFDMVEERNKSTPQKRYVFETFSKEAMLRGNQPHNNPMWKRSLHDKHGTFNPTYRSAGDWDFFLRCTFGGSKFKKIEKVLGVYYFNPKGMSTNVENKEWKQKEEMLISKTFQELYVKEKLAQQTQPALAAGV